MTSRMSQLRSHTAAGMPPVRLIKTPVAAIATATYQLTSNVNSVNEGESVIFTLTTTNVEDNNLIPYTITGISTLDIEGDILTGNFTINNGTDSITITTISDLITEGLETLVLSLDEKSISLSVDINDTSIEPPLQGLLNAWYDAADPSTVIVDSNNLVNGWNDKGIYGNHLYSPSTIPQKPTYNTRTFNGKNVVNFPVGTEYMRKDSITIPKSNISWFIVCQVDSVSSILDGIISFVGASPDYSWQLISNNSTQFQGALIRGNVAGRNVSYYGTENKIGDYHMFEITFDDNRQEDSLFLNGNFKQLMTSRAPIFQNGGTFYLFSNRSRVYQPSGAVAEVICVNSVLTETRQKIEAHLAWKWGIESKLPTDHPYKTSGSPFTNFPN